MSVTAPVCAVVFVVASFLGQMRSNGAIDDAQHLTHDRRTAGKQKPERERHTEHPLHPSVRKRHLRVPLLAHRLTRQDVIHQECGTLGHTPGTAAGTEAPTLATEGHQTLSVAILTSDTQEAMLKTTAFEVILEFAPDVIRQYLAFGVPLSLENGILFFDKLVKEGPLRAMALVSKSAGGGTGLPAKQQLQHDRVLAVSLPRLTPVAPCHNPRCGDPGTDADRHHPTKA